MSGESVLISYFFGDDMIPLGVSCAIAFRDLGYDVYRFNSQVESRWGRALLKPVNRLALEFRPRWVFVIRAHEFVDAELVRSLKQQCGVEKVFAWRVDGPLDTPDLLEDARIYDCYFCGHRHGYDPRLDKIHYLPVYGMDFSLYRNLHLGKYERDLVLVGGHNPRREHFVSQLLDLPLEIYGEWGRRARSDSRIHKRVKARYFLAHDEQRSAIADRGYKKALTLPTIRDRMREVVNQVEAL